MRRLFNLNTASGARAEALPGAGIAGLAMVGAYAGFGGCSAKGSGMRGDGFGDSTNPTSVSVTVDGATASRLIESHAKRFMAVATPEFAQHASRNTLTQHLI